MYTEEKKIMMEKTLSEWRTIAPVYRAWLLQYSTCIADDECSVEYAPFYSNGVPVKEGWIIRKGNTIAGGGSGFGSSHQFPVDTIDEVIKNLQGDIDWMKKRMEEGYK